MRRELSTTWIVVAVLAAVAVVLLLTRTKAPLQPEILEALVAVQPATSEVARVAPVEVEAGTDFRLHAVVVASDWRGRTVYYSEAAELEVGGRRVAPERVRTWDRRERVRVLWFTVEASPPYSEISSPEELERSRYRDIFQSDWPQAWTVAGRLVPAVENFLPGTEDREEPSIRFGTGRFHVRIEFFAAAGDLLPSIRVRSAGAEDLASMSDSFPGVVATLPAPLASLSRVFGLPQVEAKEGAPAEVSQLLTAEATRGLLFSRLPLLRRWLDSVGVEWGNLRWDPVELDGTSPWRGPGSLIRAGSKIAFAYQDRGIIGYLDHSDLCLDFDRGATVRTLGEIFVGRGFVELATVPGARAG